MDVGVVVVEEGVGVCVDSDASEVPGVGVAVLSGDEGTSETEASVLLSEEFVPSGEGAEVVLPSPQPAKSARSVSKVRKTARNRFIAKIPSFLVFVLFFEKRGCRRGFATTPLSFKTDYAIRT